MKNSYDDARIDRSSCRTHHARALSLIALAVLLAGALPRAFAQQPGAGNRSVKRSEGREFWYADGRRVVEEGKRLQPMTGRAKNVILFVGDGMGISTVTAARILAGQQRGESGEENALSFERLPYLALSKTYSIDQQVADSAPTMTAIITGAKTKDGVLSVDDKVIVGDHRSVAGNELPTAFELAEKAGKSTGIVTTARLTHATPGACYAHSPERDWESDANLPVAARDAGFPDIARQFVEFSHGNGLEVALGGGRSKFLPQKIADPEDPNRQGDRIDGRDLATEWVSKHPRSSYVWNKRQFDDVDAKTTDHLLGLFEYSHMRYEYDRPKDTAGEPSLSEMTSKAIDILSKGDKGYLLMVEGGRIDHAHHAGNAYRALADTIELARAVDVAMSKSDPRDTLIVVTADHSHTFTMSGYPVRGNNILGKVTPTKNSQNGSDPYTRDLSGRPYTTLGYANGPGYRDRGHHDPKNQTEGGPPPAPADHDRPDLTNVDTTNPDFRQEAAVPLRDETHGGEDVAIYAGGPGAYLFRGVVEQSVIFHVIIDALGLSVP